jgi:hypothetical protein
MITVLKYKKENNELQTFLQWERFQTIPVMFKRTTDTERQLIVDYCIAKINSLPLDIKLTVADNITGGGISITFDDKISSISTRAVYGASTKPPEGEPYVFDMCIQSIKISRSNLEKRKDKPGFDPTNNYEYALKNAVLHEILHALGYLWHTAGYIKYPTPQKPLPNRAPFKVIFRPLMCNGLGSIDLEWTYSDEIRLLWMYGSKSSQYDKEFEFKEKDIGKWCFMLHQGNLNKSVSFKITGTQMFIPYWVKGKYKKVIAEAEVHDD